ncbi:hypothetical protein HUF15_00420 [Streptomyces samsunensis]|uniref:hypothetical protein n=1 Tax=Streptomyces malaysiensis TaxID=92644 RepID=UPI0015815380|nr:hypothetical protein [Streptomyces samsunensis]NUH35246.1 hypothetical protein [Streptomyces samsunensis]
MATSTTQALPWSPPNAQDVEVLPVGKWWDAVRAAPTIGERALKTLGDKTGAVIQDKNGPLYWLVEVGTATSWHLRQVRVLTELTDESTYLGVPPASWTTGPKTHWRVPLSADRCLTHPWHLWEALAEADRAEYGRRPEGRQLCYRCQLPTDEPIPVEVEDSRGDVSKVTYACPPHVPLYSKRHPRTLTSAAATEHEGRR